MASLRSRKRGTRTYWTVRLKSGHELAAGWDKDTARHILAVHEQRERLAAHGITLPGRSMWTLKDLSDWDLAQADLSGKETASRERRWRMILLGFGPNIKIDDITSASVQKFTRERLAAGIGPATVNRDTALLRAALAKARNPASGASYSADPFAGLPRLEERKARKEPVPLEPNLLRKLIAAAWMIANNPREGADHEELRQNAAMIELAYLTASRLSQITHLRWEQVRDKLLWFPAHKKGRERYFRIEGRLRELLGALPRTSEWVFPSARSAGPREGFRRFWKTACKNAGIVGATPHTLRHSASTREFAAGRSIADIQRLLGHTTPAMAIQVYTKLYPATIMPASPINVPSRSTVEHSRKSSKRAKP